MEMQEILDSTTTIANGIFGNFETKENARKIILKMMYIACVQYQKDEKFRKEMDYWGDNI